MIENFGFFLPTEIQFGNGVLQTLGSELKKRGAMRPLVVTDQSMKETGLIDLVVNEIKKVNIPFDIFDGTVPNPRDYDCDRGAQFAKEKGSDFLIAIGGGSSMDTAKAMATIMTNGKKTRDWFDVELDVSSAPVICIPTTCGTGSEVTYNAVITDSETRLKANIFDPKCAPVLALVDPKMIKSLPGFLISSTGIDALTHAIEAHVCKIATPITDAISTYAITLISDNIVAAANDRDENALCNVMLASTMAGIAFGNADTAAVHCIAECLGGFYDIPHGVTNSIFLADVSEFSIPGNPKKYAEVSKAMGINTKGLDDTEAALLGVDKIRELCKELNIPKLKSFEVIDPKDFPHLAEASSQHCCNPNNPIEATSAEYQTIFEKVYNS